MKSIEFTEESYALARAEMRSTFLSMIVGFVIGAGLAYLLNQKSVTGSGTMITTVMVGLLLSGTPYVWKHFPYIALGWYALLIKIIVSVCLGWVITPVMLLFQYVQTKAYEGKLTREIRRENPEAPYIFELVCTALCLISVAGFVITSVIWNKIGSMSVDGGFIFVFEGYVILTSILWVLYRGRVLLGIVDILMDIVATWFLRHIWLVIGVIIYEKFPNLMIVAFLWDILILLDCIVFILGSLIRKFKKS